MEMPCKFNLRLAIVCAAAASIGMSVAFVSTARLLLVLCGLVVMVRAMTWRNTESKTSTKSTQLATSMWSTKLVLVALGAFAASMIWTVGAGNDAAMTFAKYGKLLSIALMVLLIRTRKEALLALGFFCTTQTLLVLGSWALFAGLSVPWVHSATAKTEYAVFSSYLDQGIITAVFAFCCWHLRQHIPGRYGRHAAVALSLICMANVLFVLRGRSGHMVLIALMSLSIMWALPKRLQPVVFVIPFLLTAVLFFASPTVNERLKQVVTEVGAFSSTATAVTSSGIRLNLWQRALESLLQNPLKGSGVGSWSNEYNRLEVQHNSSYKVVHQSNPHQEYLMWGMQLGIPGLILFCALLAALFVDATRLPSAHARATQCIVVGLAVACIFNSSLYDALIGDFFCVAMGLMFALGYQMRKSPLAQDRPREFHGAQTPLSKLTA